ncbi:hypothetical protein Bca4012_016972 [Brassica carinata]
MSVNAPWISVPKLKSLRHHWVENGYSRIRQDVPCFAAKERPAFQVYIISDQMKKEKLGLV